VGLFKWQHKNSEQPFRRIFDSSLGFKGSGSVVWGCALVTGALHGNSPSLGNLQDMRASKRLASSLIASWGEGGSAAEEPLRTKRNFLKVSQPSVSDSSSMPFWTRGGKNKRYGPTTQTFSLLRLGEENPVSIPSPATPLASKL